MRHRPHVTMMAAMHPIDAPRSTLLRARDATRRTRRYRPLLTIAFTAAMIGVSACGGSDDAAADGDGDAGAETDASSDTAGADASTDSADDAASDDAASDGVADGDATPADPGAVQACLDTAGYTTTASSELLSEQQLADQETQFGQIDALTFDATTVEFAGGVHFFSTADQATARGDNFADVAVAIQPVGTALILIEAGTNFEDAVAAAEGCLS